jgi:DNA polymerase-1
MPVQSSAQGIIKLAMGEMHRRREETVRFTWLLQIHDEIMVEVLDQLKNGFIAWAVSIMESAVKLSVPVVVEAKAGQNWAEMEKALVKRI